MKMKGKIMTQSRYTLDVDGPESEDHWWEPDGDPEDEDEYDENGKRKRRFPQQTAPAPTRKRKYRGYLIPDTPPLRKTSSDKKKKK